MYAALRGKYVPDLAVRLAPTLVLSTPLLLLSDVEWQLSRHGH